MCCDNWYDEDSWVLLHGELKEEFMVVEIILEGCDDSTVFEMDVTDAEYTFLKRVSDKANKTSTYDCEPRMYVREVKE